MSFQGFVFSDETSGLSDAEYQRACIQLDAAARAIVTRERLLTDNPDLVPIMAPDEGWHPDSQPSFELDGSTKNAQTSYVLLESRDRDIVRKMRLYAQAFTGYQLATLALAEHRPWVSTRLPDNLDDFLRLCVGPPDEWVFRYVSVANSLPENLRAAPPRKFGELGWLMDGAIVNFDTYSYLERLCLMQENGIFDHLNELADSRILRIVEIGGGYGGLAYHLMSIFGQKLRYGIIDIPESLAFSAVYCDTLFPDMHNRFINETGPFNLGKTPGFTFIPNTRYPELDTAGDEIDLVINTLSLSEMSDVQIEDYCLLVSKLLGTSGLFFEQNHQENHEGSGGIPNLHFKNLRRCSSVLLPGDYVSRRGQANIWVNADYTG